MNFKKNIFIGNPNLKKKKSFDVYIPSQTPGVDKNGIMVHSDGISIEKLNKLIDSPYKSVEEILTKVLVLEFIIDLNSLELTEEFPLKIIFLILVILPSEISIVKSAKLVLSLILDE